MQMTPILLIIPAVTAITNRTWRGEGQIPRWQWYGFMLALSYMVTFDWRFSIAWMVFIAGYAMAPWHAMFSAVTGRAPGRKDSLAWQWMQELANAAFKPGNYDAKWYYTRFGVIYGTIRACLMLPGIGLLCWVTHSSLPGIYGTGLLLMGFIYRWAAIVRDHFQLREDMAIPIAEVAMGWMIGTYLVACALLAWGIA